MNPLDWSVTAAQAVLSSYGLYQLGVSLAGLKPPARRLPTLGQHHHRFALVTAAHNEADVIRPHVENLLSLQYPRDMYQVYIIADNCTDETARIARSAGAIVLERHNLTQRGKGYALEWFFSDFLRTDAGKFDAVCLFDADNLVSSDFLTHMNHELSQGHQCVQAYIDSKNPLDSWVSACYSIAFWSHSRLYQTSRHRLGLSGYLGGTGMCISVNLLKEHGWNAYSLTEDLEFTVKVVRAGMRVHWCYEARVYDEKPVALSATWKQRLRWMKGHWQLCGDHAWPLLKESVRHLSFRRLDVAIHLMHPLMQITSALLMALGAVQGVMLAQGKTLLTLPWLTWLPTPVWAGFAVVGYLWPLVGMLLERVPLRAYLYYPIYIPYAFSWIPISIVAFFRRKNRTWSHTKHTRSMRLDELQRPTGGVA